MRMVAILCLLALAAPAAAAPPQRHSEQAQATEATRAGHLLPIREIERRVVPTMRPAHYLGFDFDGSSAVYTLKFMREDQVIWVDVDGRTGRIVGRAGR